MHNVETALNNVLGKVEETIAHGIVPTLIAVSKTFPVDHIEPALVAGHRHFGENKVQEGQKKWPGLREKYPDVTLHLIGPLQSNKVASAVALFDVIHTVDREKIAKALAGEMRRQGRLLEVFVQINTGSEPQKAGILPDDADDFIKSCSSRHGLHVTGLMCIPPFNADPVPHFKLLAEIAEKHGLRQLSMGMSDDYVIAIKHGATHVRVGSAIFGTRTQPEQIDEA